MNEYQALHVFEGEDGDWYWHVKSGNGKIVAVGGEGYSSEAGAYRGFAAAAQTIVDMAGHKLAAEASSKAAELEGPTKAPEA